MSSEATENFIITVHCDPAAFSCRKRQLNKHGPIATVETKDSGNYFILKYRSADVPDFTWTGSHILTRQVQAGQ